MCNLIIYTDYLFWMDKKTFNVDWFNNPAYNKWIAKDENPYKAQCRVCYWENLELSGNFMSLKEWQP